MAARTKRRVKNRSKAHRKHTKRERSRRIKSRSNPRNGVTRRRRKNAQKKSK